MHSSCRCQRPRTISHRFPVPPRRLSAGGEGWSSTKQRGSHTCSLPHTSLASGCCSPPGTSDTIPANWYTGHSAGYHSFWGPLSARHRPELSTAHRGQHSEENRWHWYSPGLLGKVCPHTGTPQEREWWREGWWWWREGWWWWREGWWWWKEGWLWWWSFLDQLRREVNNTTGLKQLFENCKY